ncbi:LysR family transcriptional regulator [Tolumonas lignilytica]|uniref:LysR family transcriptional regulator n=1 Tax=Tolumonas lignilytica TaxID=1283284 RepID=UPI000466793B|nr:LysR family transcriptional regulator [Tolumonas lignilytica]
MIKENINDLLSFLEVAGERNFTKAAVKLGVSQSALSHTIKALEARLGVRLLNRTTRSVSLTEAGERLLLSFSPRISEMEEELVAIREQQTRPSGKIRISTPEYAAHHVIWPFLETFLPKYPDIHFEVIIENSFTDIVAERFDAGVRLGEQVAKDMIATRISSDLRMQVVGAPSYFEKHSNPVTPNDLQQHQCINLKPSLARSVYAWEFAKDEHIISVKVEGQLIFNTSLQIKNAALAGFGLGYLPYDMVKSEIESGLLVNVLDAWCPSFNGFHLYYPSRKQHTKAFKIFLEELKAARAS